ncbi:MAG: dTDP-glucose 4,6-dehydratase [Syntrophorhabdus sp. PtaU1.Bin153]|nr:MAG: dTDP-glucose 4,6-dehydratase [Syntrophorhabdus sp. PtaU1.Bin153]
MADSPRYTFVRGDIANKADLAAVFDSGIDMVVNFAAESHVDRSILDPDTFIRTNINGTFNLLEEVRKRGIQRFLQISTDEVYGSLGKEGKFTESTPLAPNSPYSASKASADMLAMAYCKTYGTPVVMTRCSNNYGPYQFPEKLIPLIITNALENKDLPVYGDGMNIRDWIHVQDHVIAIDTVLHKGEVGTVYNVGGENERTNIEIVKLILNILGKSESLIKYVTDRPGHDRRYAIDSTKVKRELAFAPTYDFKKGMEDTVAWYLGNREWWERIKSGAYLEYYDQMYKNR